MNKKQTLRLADILGRMKTLKRVGWIKRLVKNSESDADHSYSLALLTMLLAPDNLDQLKCLKLALVHDLPEVFCGDFVPGEIDPQEKSKLEKSAMRKVAADIGCPQLVELFEEYEQKSTPEAEFVHTLDALDNVFSARFYEDKSKHFLTDEFAASAFARITNLKDKGLKNKLQEILKFLN